MPQLRRKSPPFIVPFNPDADARDAIVIKKPDSGFQLIRIPSTQRRPGEPSDQALRRIDVQNNIMGNTGLDQQYRDDLENPPIRPAVPRQDQGYIAPPPVFQEPTPTLDEIGPPPIMIRRNNKQRPLEALGGADDLQRDEALYEAQQAYKAPRSTKDLLLRLAQGFIGGGLPGAAAQGLGYELNPEIRNQDAVGADMAQTRGRLVRGYAERKAQNDLMNDRSRRGLEDARAQELLTREPKVEADWFPVDTDGDGIPDTEERRPLTIGARRNVFQKPRVERQPILKTVQNPDGTISTKMSTDNGSTWTEVPDLLSRPAPKVDGVDPSGNIQAARDEQAKIDAGLAQIAEQLKSTPPLVNGYENPAYTELNRRAAQGTARRQHLDDQIRGWQMKSPRSQSGAASGKKWSLSQWRKNNPDKDPEKAKAAAQARGWVVTE